jgi:glyoxylase-like metal-dependent hydrolase (beta-lactamase superfamily II)
MGIPRWKIDILLPGSWRGATCTLLSDGRQHIVVDTGLPHEEFLIVKALESRDLKPTDIGIVVNTHMHIDHVLNNCLFPRSLIYASQESYDWCRSLYTDLLDEANWERLTLQYYPETYSYSQARERMTKLRNFALRWWDLKRVGETSQFRWLETNSLPDGVEPLITSGHVPGHASLLIYEGGTTSVVAGDALLSREHDDQILTMIPHRKEQYSLDRAHILSVGGHIVPGHDHEFHIAPDGEKTPAETIPEPKPHGNV